MRDLGRVGALNALRGVAGNNELRVNRKEKFTDSFKKWKKVLEIANSIPNVHTTPQLICGVWIVPLFSWYEPNLDPDYDKSTDYQRRWLDFRACRWPPEYYTETNHLKLDQYAL